IGSTPAERTIVAAGMAAIATIARLLSVTFTASTAPFRVSARRRTTLAAALFGGFSSAVTTNSPDLRRLANALNEKDLSFLARGLPVRSSLSSPPGALPCQGLRPWVGIGTVAGLRRLPRRHRAVPSASLDERGRV